MSLLKQFQEGHRHPVNRVCHGVAFLLLIVAFSLFSVQWRTALVLALAAMTLLIFGHHIEGRYPAVFHELWKKIIRLRSH